MIEELIKISSYISWRDCIEILVLSATIYYLSIWLKKDRQKNLLPYLYGYCFLLGITFFLQCATITFLLTTFAPVGLMALFLVHQHTLQKNFITLRNIVHPARLSNNQEWLSALMSASLVNLNNNRDLLLVVERSQALQDFLHASIRLDAPINKDILTLILENQNFDAQKIIWINARGNLIGINGSWSLPSYTDWNTIEVKKVAPWQQEALYVTGKSDAIVIYMSGVRKNATFVMHGKIIDNITATQTFNLLKEYIHTPVPTEQKGDVYGTHHTDRAQQPNP